MTTNRPTVATVRRTADAALAAGTPMQCFEWSTMNVARKRGIDIELVVHSDESDVKAVAAAVSMFGTVEIVRNSVRLTRKA